MINLKMGFQNCQEMYYFKNEWVDKIVVSKNVTLNLFPMPTSKLAIHQRQENKMEDAQVSKIVKMCVSQTQLCCKVAN